MRVQPATSSSTCDHQSHYRFQLCSHASNSTFPSPRPSPRTRKSSSNSLALCPSSPASRTKLVESSLSRHAGRVRPEFAQGSSSSPTRPSALHPSRPSRPSRSSSSSVVDHPGRMMEGGSATSPYNTSRPSYRNVSRLRSKADRSAPGVSLSLQRNTGLPLDVLRIGEQRGGSCPPQSSRRGACGSSPGAR